MKDIRLICCDLDGTLLRSDKSISDKTLSTLGQCREKGIPIARNKGQYKKPGHLKKLYCLNCKKEILDDLSFSAGIMKLDSAQLKSLMLDMGFWQVGFELDTNSRK